MTKVLTCDLLIGNRPRFNHNKKCDKTKEFRQDMYCLPKLTKHVLAFTFKTQRALKGLLTV